MRYISQLANACRSLTMPSSYLDFLEKVTYLGIRSFWIKATGAVNLVTHMSTKMYFLVQKEPMSHDVRAKYVNTQLCL